MTALVHTRAELASALAGIPGSTAVVMTMGALHEGHEALIRAARERADHVLVTIFVNPLQFGPNEDFDRYPRSLDADLAVAGRAGAHLVFAPAPDEVYPGGAPAVRVDPGPLGGLLEGASRPGFFHGVLTVVLKLLHLTRPDVALFGEKDYQQLALVRRMVRDLDLDVEIVGVPTEREPDGLARSSRNRYLSPPERRAALALAAALRAGAEAARAGAGPDGTRAGSGADGVRAGSGADGVRAGSGADGAIATAHAAFDRAAAAEPDVAVKLDYLVLTDPQLGPAPSHGPARMLIAAWVGGTRLIDNLALEMA